MSSESSVVGREPENEFTTTHHVYEPHRGGVPPIVPYVRELWRRREFASEMSKATLRGANTLTLFGQLWLVLNPLLLAAVYYLLVQVISGADRGWDYFARLCAGLFAFYFVSAAMSTGASSVTGGGKLLLNTAFPRLLMPFASVRTAFFRYLPTLPVYAVLHLLGGTGWSWGMLAAIPFLALIIIFSQGLAALFATMQVYFRDTASFLPYINRIWLYASPVLWSIESVPPSFSAAVDKLSVINPLFSLLGGYSEALVYGNVPDLRTWIEASIWALVSFVVGSLYFMSREREFAVRI